ncbi:MAG: sigma-70 family RNA polymerase sigma factor, partial [Planctomycetota bacterium]
KEDSEASFYAWLKTIAMNRIRDAARSASSKKRGGDRVRVTSSPDESNAGVILDALGAQDDITPSRAAASAERIDAMRIAMATLSEDQQEALKLHYFQRLSLDETAEAMGRTTGSIRGLIQRAKEKLRDEMDRASKWLSG